MATLCAIPTYWWWATTNTTTVFIKNGGIANHLTWEFYIEACNNTDRSLAWDSKFWFSSKLIFRKKTNWEKIEAEVIYPLQNTTPNPWCSTIHWTLPAGVYWEIDIVPECKNEDILTWCGYADNKWIIIDRKNISYILIDASAQSFMNAQTWEVYDSINPKILSRELKDSLITQAPWRAKYIRDWLYKNPQERPLICWDLTEEEKIYFENLMRDIYPQYINTTRFCTREELLKPQDEDIRLMLYLIWDCDIPTDDRWLICNYWPEQIKNNLTGVTSPLYSRRIHESNPNSIVIFLPAIKVDVKTK